MTLTEARKIFKTYGGLKYSGSRNILLHALLNSTYRGKNKEVDITGRPFTVKASTLQQSVQVEDQQLMRLLKSLDEVTHLVRKDGKITFRLDLKPLEDESLKTAQDEANSQRTEDARLKKASQRSCQKVKSIQTFFAQLQEENRLRAAKINEIPA